MSAKCYMIILILYGLKPVQSFLKDRPKLVLQEGNVIITPQINKNITFQTRGAKSTINFMIDGRSKSLSDLSNDASASRALPPDILDRVRVLENSVDTHYTSRMQTLEDTVRRLDVCYNLVKLSTELNNCVFLFLVSIWVR